MHCTIIRNGVCAVATPIAQSSPYGAGLVVVLGTSHCFGRTEQALAGRGVVSPSEGGPGSLSLELKPEVTFSSSSSCPSLAVFLAVALGAPCFAGFLALWNIRC